MTAKRQRANLLTVEDCAEFDRYILKWQKLLNLSDWRIERGNGQSAKNMAEVCFDPGARMAVYKVGQSFGATPVTPTTLEETAVHELLHVLLFDLLQCAPGELEGAEHRVINVLEKLLFKGIHAPQTD